MYKFTSKTLLSELPKKDMNAVNLAYNTAYESNFHSSLRLGCCITSSKGCVLRG